MYMNQYIRVWKLFVNYKLKFDRMEKTLTPKVFFHLLLLLVCITDGEVLLHLHLNYICTKYSIVENVNINIYISFSKFLQYIVPTYYM